VSDFIFFLWVFGVTTKSKEIKKITFNVKWMAAAGIGPMVREQNLVN